VVSKDTIATLTEFSDFECAQVIIMGIARLLQAKVDPVQILQFVEETIAAIRLAEADRVHVRDEGAN